MKKVNSRGFSTVEALLILLVVGLIGGAGWYVYDKQKSESSDNTTAVKQSDNITEETRTSGLEDTSSMFKYSVPSGWQNVNRPFEPYKTGSGNYLMSPDYKEAGGGQLSIVAGAFIHFQDATWEGINANTTVEQAANIVKNGEGGYLEPSSVKVESIGGKQVVTFNAGHTTDGVTVIYKDANGGWIEVGFSTVAGDDGVYKAQESPHYNTFLSWLDEFIKLN